MLDFFIFQTASLWNIFSFPFSHNFSGCNSGAHERNRTWNFPARISLYSLCLDCGMYPFYYKSLCYSKKWSSIFLSVRRFVRIALPLQSFNRDSRLDVCG